jgi:hypothetical protein
MNKQTKIIKSIVDANGVCFGFLKSGAKTAGVLCFDCPIHNKCLALQQEGYTHNKLALAREYLGIELKKAMDE